MAKREYLMEALDAIETGMCRIKESRMSKEVIERG